MQIIDCQVHCYERDRPERPWIGTLAGPKEVTGDDMVKAMDDVGVAGAILVSPYAMYRFDASYALEVYKQHPKRFALVKPVDTTRPDVGEVVADWGKTEGTVGVRIMMALGATVDPQGPGVKATLDAAGESGQPVNLLCWGAMDAAAGMADRHPNTQLVIDHLGLHQPFDPPAPDAPFADLPDVLKLAEKPNIAIKISGACTLSKTGYPYDDIWDPVCSIVDAFGLDRCMWGTDWTRAVNLLTYEQGVRPFVETDRFSASDKEKLMGGTLARIYGWTPG